MDGNGKWSAVSVGEVRKDERAERWRGGGVDKNGIRVEKYRSWTAFWELEKDRNAFCMGRRIAIDLSKPLDIIGTLKA